ncbi:MAG: AIR synthase family protein [Desulfurococcales archaeon]|nr:AIR synthase family protein [Desulfurococcales archaeon]
MEDEFISVGKVPYSILQKILDLNSVSERKEVIVGPSLGEDAAVIRIDDTDYVIVVHTDPITEAFSKLGWLSINVAANDIAVTGARPSWFTVTILMPPGSIGKDIINLASEISSAARSLGGVVVGGHTEVSPGISKPILITTAIGVTNTNTFIRTGGAKPGSFVFQVKPAALEGTAIIGHDFYDKLISRGVPEHIIVNARGFINEISIVEPAVALAEKRLVESMHDPTEGGLIGGLIELARASNVSLNIEDSKIIVRKETMIISEALNINWMKLVSSGAIIGTLKPEYVDEASNIAEKTGFEFSIIGKVLRYSGFDVFLEKEDKFYNGYIRDEISGLFDK